jgi:hypothetical protein
LEFQTDRDLVIRFGGIGKRVPAGIKAETRVKGGDVIAFVVAQPKIGRS